MSVQTLRERDGSRRSPLRNPFKLLISSEPWLALLFMLSSFALGVFWFVVLTTLISTGGGLLITLIGFPILVGTFYLWVYGARFERHRVRALLGVRIDDPYRPLPDEPWFGRLKARLGDRYVWFDLLYLFILFPVGIVEFVIATVALSLPLAFLTLPGWYWIADGAVFFDGYQVDTLPIALAFSVIGIPFLLALPYVLVGVGRGHAWLARNLLGTNRERELSARVDQLTVSRSRALDYSVGDLRRIERDLHDGAQQRLVKLSMDLGMAKEKIATDPEAAQVLINEAHEEAKRAMVEIRNLARGIHPAVLTDRGLDAAVSALAGRSPVPVTVHSNLDGTGRLPEVVESSAYFIIAEALTNIARHSSATESSVRIRKRDDMLAIDIDDNGSGGADMSRGTGLEGMLDRATAIDGTLTIESPPGGPTHIHVELPCEL
jgi:signal transduction histidine kinase